MRKNRIWFTYLFLILSTSVFSQYSYEDSEDTEPVEEYEEGSFDNDEDVEVYEVEESSDSRSSGLAYEYEGFSESTSNNRYLDNDTSFKSRYQGDEYQYHEKPPKKDKKKDDPKEQKGNISDGDSYSPPRGSGGAGFGVLATVFFYLFLALAIGLIGYLIFQATTNLKIQKKPKLKRVEPHIEIEEDIEKIEELDPNDLRALIKKAKESGNFPLATRFYFLLYLEQLQDRKAIKYHRDKTNADYLSEIKSGSTTAQFVKLSYLFEYVWYGKKPLDETSFNSLETIFHKQLTAKK
jgi:hypothetical protein